MVKINFLIAYHTDVGRIKQTNQDALLIKTAMTAKGRIGLFVVCDGMGGLAHGEVASSSTIKAVENWFEDQLPNLILHNDYTGTEIIRHFEKFMHGVHRNIFHFGVENDIQLGTTFTALLVLFSEYYILHIGDSRVYAIASEILQLTKDQTFIAREIEKGHLTIEQAQDHPKRNILLQSLGASKDIEIDLSRGGVISGMMFLLCTDGFYQKIDSDEFSNHFLSSPFYEKQKMKEKLIELTELVKDRDETDNISAILVKVF